MEWVPTGGSNGAALNTESRPSGGSVKAGSQSRHFFTAACAACLFPCPFLYTTLRVTPRGNSLATLSKDCGSVSRILHQKLQKRKERNFFTLRTSPFSSHFETFTHPFTMHTIREIDTRLGPNILEPCFRKVDFEDESNIVTVSTFLRQAWTALPSGDDIAIGLGQFMKKLSRMDEEERTKVPQDPDLTTVHNTWKDEVYRMWNHVFYDVMNFLPEAAMGVGHFHPPNQDVFAVEFAQEENEAPMTKTWDTNVVIIHTYLAAGVKIRLSTKSQEVGDDSEVTLGTFDGSNEMELWYIAKGTTVSIHVEGDFEKESKGHAAVMVYGICCLEDHCHSCGKVHGEDEEHGVNN